MFRVKMDTRAAEKDLTNTQKQLLFAMELALNRTQEDKQRVMGGHVVTTLTVRNGVARREFPKVIRFARDDRADRKKGRMTASLRVLGKDTKATAPLYERFAAIVLRHDDGGDQTSSRLYRAQNKQFTVGGFAIPAPGLRTASRGVSQALYPDNLGLGARSLRYEDSDDPARQYKGGKKKRGKGFRKGTRYYFVKEGVGIFVRQQVGDQSEYDAVWFFDQRINLPKRIRLEATHQRGLAEDLQANYQGFLAFALRTAK